MAEPVAGAASSRKRRREGSPGEGDRGRAVLVEAVALGGEVLAELVLGLETTVEEVKLQVEASTGIFALDQHLILPRPAELESCGGVGGAQPLPDDADLASLVGEVAGNEGTLRLVLTVVRARRPLALSAGRCGDLKLWDLDAGRPLREFRAGVRSVLGLSVDWESHRALAWGAVKPPWLLDFFGREDARMLDGRGSTGGSVGVLADWRRDRALSRDRDGGLRLWDLKLGELSRTFRGAAGKITSMQVNWMQDRALVAGQFGKLELWTFGDSQPLRVLDTDSISGLQVDWEGERALSVYGNALLLWDLSPSGASSPTAELMHENFVLGASVDWAKDRALTWVAEGVLLIWDLAKGVEVRRIVQWIGEVPALSVDWKGDRALSWSWCHGPYLLDLRCAEPARLLSGGRGKMLEAQVDWEGGRVIGRSWDRSLCVWDVGKTESEDVVRELRGHEGKVTGLQADWASARALSWGADGALRLWDLERGEALGVLEGHASKVEFASLRPLTLERAAGA